MLSHNYDVAAKNAKSETTTGANLYKSQFSDSAETTYVWSQRAQSLSEILQSETLPLVVKLCHDNVVNDTETPVDLQRPLLLYKEIKGKKLHARNLRTRAATRDTARTIYQPAGPYVTFPEKFPGFFKVIDSKDQPLTTVADIGRLMSQSFISVSPSPGFCVLRQLEDTLYTKATLPPGLYRPLNILEGTIMYINKRKTEKKKLVRCLTCEDEKGKTVLFPMENKGQFYISEVSTRFSKHFHVQGDCRVYKWTDYDPSRLKGLRVKMIHGKPPEQECKFSGFLEFSKVTEEHTVLGSTMTSSPRLFEMAVTDEPFFIVALNSNDVTNGGLYQKSLKFAKNESDSYMKAIKVKKDYDIDQANCQEQAS